MVLVEGQRIWQLHSAVVTPTQPPWLKLVSAQGTQLEVCLEDIERIEHTNNTKVLMLHRRGQPFIALQLLSIVRKPASGEQR